MAASRGTRLGPENVEAVKRGIANLQRHVENLRKIRPAGGGRGQPFHLRYRSRVRRDPRRDGGAGYRGDLLHPLGAWRRGAEDLARAVVSRIEAGTAAYQPLYPLEMKLTDKIRTIAQEIYRAADISVSDSMANKLASFEAAGFGDVPVCIAKTQYSFTADPTVMGAPTGHVLPVREVRLSAGRRVRGGDLRRHHDHAGAAARSGGRVDPSARRRGDRRSVLTPVQMLAPSGLANHWSRPKSAIEVRLNRLRPGGGAGL